MPGIFIGNSVINNKSQTWGTYWDALISAVVEDANPDKVVIVYSKAFTAVVTDYKIAGKTISSIALSADKLTHTLTLSAAVEYGEVLTVSFKGLTAKAITNNVLYTMTLDATGDGTGVSTLSMQTTANIAVVLSGAARFYTDAAGTQNESTTWNIVSGADRTIYLKCTSGASKMKLSDASKLIKIGGDGVAGWASSTNAAKLTLSLLRTRLESINASGNMLLQGALPETLLYVFLGNNVVSWTYNGALPVILKHLYFNSNNIYWTYNGALPTGLTYFVLVGTNIEWAYNGAFPGSGYITLVGPKINWTGLSISGTANNTGFYLGDFRITKMSSADMVTLLNNLRTKTGTFPATITINDFQDYASPPQAVTDAVAALKTAKSITTVNLGA